MSERMSDRPIGGVPAILRRRLETLPDGPGVYIWKDRAGELLYVGKAGNLRNRVRSYLTADHGDSPKNSRLKRLIHDVETIVVATEGQALSHAPAAMALMAAGGAMAASATAPRAAAGAWVEPRPGGTLVRVGEAGQGEVIAPMPKLEQSMTRAIAMAGGA
ncbi:MAG: nucleotide excision repair endonuclease, partial [Gemmatimonadota bacterium]